MKGDKQVRDVDVLLWDRFKKYCKKNNVTIGNAFNDIIKDFLDKHDKK